MAQMSDSDGMLRVLVHGRVTPEALDAIRAAAGLQTLVLAPTDREEALRLLPTVQVAFGQFPPERIAAAAPPLRWVQFPSAGIENILTDALMASGVTVTTGRGVYGIAGAEHLLGMMLMFTRCLKDAYDQQKEARWDQQIFYSLRKLQGQTLGIVGLGNIGSSLATRAKAFGMTVVAIKRKPAERSPCVDLLWGTERLHDLMGVSDHVVLTVPLTPLTRGMIDAQALARMKPTAYLYNIGRGAVIDQSALIRCLQERAIAGAGLDVFTEEPLPADSPLWQLPNVILTPHLGANLPDDWTNASYLFARNLKRYQNDEDLLNVVDFEQRY